MSTKTWSHVSPTVGLSQCDAQSPDACKFKDQSRHFSNKAVERINAGRPANFDEHAAMMQDREIRGVRSMEGTGKAPAPAPKPGAPRPVPSAPKPQAFPTQHRSSAQSNVRPFPTQHRGQRPVETLYHMDIGFPASFKKPSGVKQLEYSRHALNAALDDRYGKMPVLQKINVDKLQVVELGVQDGKVSKIVYRGHLDQDRDMCVVVIPKPEGQAWFVKTVWLNMRSDEHKTLDETKYARPAA